MQQNFQNPAPQPLNKRNQPQRMRSMSILVLVFAIIHSVNLIALLIYPFLPFILSLVTFVLAIVLLVMSPKKHKVGFSASFGISADLLLVLGFICLSMLHIELSHINALNPMPNTYPPLSDEAAGFVFISVWSLFLSWIFRVVSLVFGYISFASLKKGAAQGMMNNSRM